jgi:zinc/manganese transport system substrate-binding protein
MKSFFYTLFPKAAAVGAALFLILGLPFVAQAKINAVATTPDLGAIATAIGGKNVQVTSLARPTEDPHFVDAKPSFILKLNRAEALIEGGAELEIGWLPALLENARNPKIDAGAPGRISCVAGVDLMDIPATLDRSKGDIHAMGNPHYMTDPINAKIAAGHICDGFVALDAKNAEFYKANLVHFNAQVDEKLAVWQKTLAPYEGTRLVAYHNTWPYFARRFHLRIDLFLEPKPGIPPTPAHMAEVIDTMKTGHLRAILVEPYQNRKTAEKAAAEAGSVILNFTQYPGGAKGSEGGYIELMDYLVNTLARALATTSK